jgi:hypothetical protein
MVIVRQFSIKVSSATFPQLPHIFLSLQILWMLGRIYVYILPLQLMRIYDFRVLLAHVFCRCIHHLSTASICLTSLSSTG